jgi:hypothetical protein
MILREGSASQDQLPVYKKPLSRQGFLLIKRLTAGRNNEKAYFSNPPASVVFLFCFQIPGA